MIEPNYSLQQNRTAPVITTPPIYTADFFRNMIHAEAAWRLGVYGQGVKVAIIDTGVDIAHPILRSHLAPNEAELFNGNNNIDEDENGFIDDFYGWNFVSNQSTLSDETGHGTGIAGIITGDPGGPSLALAPQSQILAVDFMAETDGTEFHAQQAIAYAISRHVQIINNSWTINCSVLLKDSFEKWNQENIIFVNASGNLPIDVYLNDVTPSSFSNPNIVNVGSSDDFGNRSSFSGYGKTVTLFAPGESIPIIYANSGWDEAKAASGTSFSAAIVSGAAALVWSAFPRATAAEIITLLHEGSSRGSREPSETKVLDVKKSLAIGRKRFRLNPQLQPTSARRVVE